MELNGDCRSKDLDDVVTAENAPCVAPVSVLSDSALHLKHKQTRKHLAAAIDLISGRKTKKNPIVYIDRL